MRSLRILLASKTDNNVVSKDSQIGYRSAGSVTIDPLARRIAQRLRARQPDSFDE
jgi:hypothetical protein